MAIESTRERRERLNAISARVALNQHTVEDVQWLLALAEEYITSWERTVGQLQRRAQQKRSTAWPADADARSPRRRPSRRGGAR